MNDPISDLLCRMRNAAMVGKKDFLTPDSSLRKVILDVLIREGYIQDYHSLGASIADKKIKVILKYYAGRPAFSKLNRVSRLGRRVYSNVRSMPRVLNGLGCAVLSTSKGVLSDREAVAQKVGGEVLFYVS